MTPTQTLLAIGGAIVALVAPLTASAQDAHDADAHETHGVQDEHGEHDGHDEHAGHDEHDETVALDAAELEEFDIHVGTAGPGRIEHVVALPGEVRPNADRLAHIVPRYAGIVTEVRAHVGDRVEKGDVLAIVESDESLAPFPVTTLISGTVIAKHIALGEAASRDRDVFVIADLGTVWIDLTVYQRDVARVRVGQRVRVYVGHALAEDTAVIDYVTPVVDERTRTATARVVLQNPDGAWRPGMFVTGKVLVAGADAAVAVPRTAIHTFEDRPVVFVETGEGFRPQPVEIGAAGETHVEILSGLEPGRRYVTRGGFTIKAELGKSSFGHGHSH